MATASASIALFITINLVLFTFTSANYCPPCGKRKPKKKHYKPKPPSPPPPSPPPPCPPPTRKPPSSQGKCPIDALKLGVCANVLGGLINVRIGTPPKTPCCSLLKGLVDLEAALCLCTAIKADVLGIIHLDVPVSLSLLLNYCGMKVPRGFQCP